MELDASSVKKELRQCQTLHECSVDSSTSMTEGMNGVRSSREVFSTTLLCLRQLLSIIASLQIARKLKGWV
eukprot:5535291-Amphidinium_carterae.1